VTTGGTAAGDPSGRAAATRKWVAAALGLTVVVDLFFGVGIVAALPKEPARIFIDFFMLWSSARYVLAEGVAGLWTDALNRFQEGLLGGHWNWHPFPYPPLFLLVVVPLGLLPYFAAYLVAMGASAAAFVAAAATRPWKLTTLVLLTSPAALLNALFGHNGFLTAALLAGGARLLRERPVLAGVLFGGLAYKPQLALVVPVALVAARAWRTLASAAATTALLVLASVALFGVGAWIEWIGFLPRFSSGVVEFADIFFPRMASVTPALLRVGLPPAAAFAVQAIVALTALAAVWLAYRRAPESRAAGAVLLAAPFLVTPYAYAYDLPAAAVAVAWLAIGKMRDGASLIERAVLTLGWLVPLAGMFPLPDPLAPAVPLVLAGLLAVAAGEALRPTRVAPGRY
jgi:alpha-1,2-mannosyltransferase